jgi:hypothetical protein
MKGYGLPRYSDLECPDCADINLYGLKSTYGMRLNNRKRSRRLWKKKERAKAKRELHNETI